MVKYLKTIAILIILIGLPLGSWYFLKSGLDWRRAKVVKLQQKENFFTAFEFSKDDKNSLYEIMAHRTSVVKKDGTLNDNDRLIIDQFEDAYTFQFVSLARSEPDDKGSWSSKSALRYYKPSSVESVSDQITDWNYLLVDTSGYIRQLYAGEEKQVMKILVEDIAVILPRKKEKDIVIRDMSNQN